MDRKETESNCNDPHQQLNSDLKSELTKKVKTSNEKPGSSSSTVNFTDQGSVMIHDDQNIENSTLIQDDSKGSIDKDIMTEEEEETDSVDILFNLTEEEKFLAQQIFLNHLTLREIFANSAPSDLFSFRSVNKLWETESTSVIMKASVNQVYLRFNWSTEIYEVRTIGYFNNKGNLNELNNCISSSRRFPCSNFAIENSKNLDKSEIAKLLLLHGEEIKTLSFTSQTLESYIPHLRKILIEQAPNISKLKILEISLIQVRECLFLRKVILPHLICFHFEQYCKQNDEIIMSSPNLQEISGNVFQSAFALIKVKKIHLVKELKLNYDGDGCLEMLKKWGESNLKLNKLTLSTKIPDMGPYLSMFLDSIQESLKEISLNLFTQFFEGVKWPELKYVQKVILNRSDDNDHQLPTNFISTTFPNITSLKISEEGPSVMRFINTDSPLLYLTSIELFDETPSLLQLLSSIGPHVEELHIHFVTNFFGTISMIWDFFSLKKIYLSFIRTSQLDFKFHQIDMAITGISEEMVRKLQEEPIYFEEMKIKAKEIPRVTPSILDCEALEELTFDFLDFGFQNYGLQQEENRHLTFISEEFGFKLMSQLKVKILCHDGDKGHFQSLAHYIKNDIKPNPMRL